MEHFGEVITFTFQGKEFKVHEEVLVKRLEYFGAAAKFGRPNATDGPRELFGPTFDQAHAQCIVPLTSWELGALIHWAYTNKKEALWEANDSFVYWNRVAETLALKELAYFLGRYHWKERVVSGITLIYKGLLLAWLLTRLACAISRHIFNATQSAVVWVGTLPWVAISVHASNFAYAMDAIIGHVTQSMVKVIRRLMLLAFFVGCLWCVFLVTQRSPNSVDDMIRLTEAIRMNSVQFVHGIANVTVETVDRIFSSPAERQPPPPCASLLSSVLKESVQPINETDCYHFLLDWHKMSADAAVANHAGSVLALHSGFHLVVNIINMVVILGTMPVQLTLYFVESLVEMPLVALGHQIRPDAMPSTFLPFMYRAYIAQMQSNELSRVLDNITGAAHTNYTMYKRKQ